MSTKGEAHSYEKEQLARLKQTLADIRYIIRQYRKDHPEEAWETIKKLASDPKLRLKNIKGQFEQEVPS